MTTDSHLTSCREKGDRWRRRSERGRWTLKPGSSIQRLLDLQEVCLATTGEATCKRDLPASGGENREAATKKLEDCILKSGLPYTKADKKLWALTSHYLCEKHGKPVNQVVVYQTWLERLWVAYLRANDRKIACLSYPPPPMHHAKPWILWHDIASLSEAASDVKRLPIDEEHAATAEQGTPVNSTTSAAERELASAEPGPPKVLLKIERDIEILSLEPPRTPESKSQVETRYDAPEENELYKSPASATTVSSTQSRVFDSSLTLAFETGTPNSVDASRHILSHRRKLSNVSGHLFPDGRNCQRTLFRESSSPTSSLAEVKAHRALRKWRQDTSATTEFEDTAAHDLHVVSRYESKRVRGKGTNKDLVKDSNPPPRIRLYWQHGKVGRTWVNTLRKNIVGQHEFNGEAAPYQIDVQILSARSHHPLSRKPDGTSTSTIEYFTRRNTPKRRTDIISNLKKSLGKGSIGEGTIYGFERDDAPGFIKIGKGAYDSCTQRYGCIMTDCGYQPRVLFEAQMPCAAKMMEDLIHLDLADYQRWDNSCEAFARQRERNTSNSWEIKSTCSKRHMEWFEIDVAKAIRVVERWQAFSWYLSSLRSGGLAREGLDQKVCHFLQENQNGLTSPGQFSTKERWKLMKEVGQTLETKASTVKSPTVRTRTRHARY